MTVRYLCLYAFVRSHFGTVCMKGDVHAMHGYVRTHWKQWRRVHSAHVSTLLRNAFSANGPYMSPL